MENFQCHRLLYILALKINKLLLLLLLLLLTFTHVDILCLIYMDNSSRSFVMVHSDFLHHVIFIRMTHQVLLLNDACR